MSKLSQKRAEMFKYSNISKPHSSIEQKPIHASELWLGVGLSQSSLNMAERVMITEMTNPNTYTCLELDVCLKSFIWFRRTIS